MLNNVVNNHFTPNLKIITIRLKVCGCGGEVDISPLSPQLRVPCCIAPRNPWRGVRYLATPYFLNILLGVWVFDETLSLAVCVWAERAQ